MRHYPLIRADTEVIPRAAPTPQRRDNLGGIISIKYHGCAHLQGFDMISCAFTCVANLSHHFDRHRNIAGSRKHGSTRHVMLMNPRDMFEEEHVAPCGLIVSAVLRPLTQQLMPSGWRMLPLPHARCPAEIPLEDFAKSQMELEITPTAISLTMCAIIRTIQEYPEYLAKIHEELDSVVGTSRLPTQEDLKNLPYLQGFIQGTLRLGGLTPLSLPRAPLHDDEYMSYSIPKYVMVFAFQYGMNTDETIFKNPMTLNPSRWIDDPNLPKALLFGFGKRACPGKGFVGETIPFVMARILWGYDFYVPEDTQVEQLADNLIFHLEATTHIKYTCRSDTHRALIEEAYIEARNVNMEPSLDSIRDFHAQS